jgi:hypothetical protein
VECFVDESCCGGREPYRALAIPTEFLIVRPYLVGVEVAKTVGYNDITGLGENIYCKSLGLE